MRAGRRRVYLIAVAVVLVALAGLAALSYRPMMVRYHLWMMRRALAAGAVHPFTGAGSGRATEAVLGHGLSIGKLVALGHFEDRFFPFEHITEHHQDPFAVMEVLAEDIPSIVGITFERYGDRWGLRIIALPEAMAEIGTAFRENDIPGIAETRRRAKTEGWIKSIDELTEQGLPPADQGQ